MATVSVGLFCDRPCSAMILNDAYVVTANGDWRDFFDFVRHSRCVFSGSITPKQINIFFSFFQKTITTYSVSIIL